MEHVAAFFSTDGIQPLKSSHPQLGLFAFASLPPNIRMNRDNLITLALWVGSKPPMNLPLKPLQQVMKRILSNGVCVRTPGVFDLVAKVPVLNMHQFNGYNG